MGKPGDQQFEDLVFPGVPGGTVADPKVPRGYRQQQMTYRGMVPATPEGHNRLWRATDFSDLRSGHWAARPLPAYGSSMLYMDVPHEKMPNSLSKTGRDATYLIGRDRSGQAAPMPGQINKVQFHSEKEYEGSDWEEYRERWG